MNKKKTISQKLAEILSQMKVGDSFGKKAYIIQIYKNYDELTVRSLDVHFTMAKKLVPTMEFRTIKGKITRIK